MFFQGHWLFYISGVCLIIVGLCPNFERRHTIEAFLHVAAATTAVLSGLLSLWVADGMWYMFIVPVVAIIILQKYKRKWKLTKLDWWLEIGTSLIMMVGMIVKKFKTKSKK
jgi:hypothetical protein